MVIISSRAGAGQGARPVQVGEGPIAYTRKHIYMCLRVLRARCAYTIYSVYRGRPACSAVRYTHNTYMCCGYTFCRTSTCVAQSLPSSCCTADDDDAPTHCQYCTCCGQPGLASSWYGMAKSISHISISVTMLMVVHQQHQQGYGTG